MPNRPPVLPFLATLFPVIAAPGLFSAAEDHGFFESRIRPVLVSQCFECHSAEAGKSKGGLVLDSRAGWELGGDSGPAIVPGKPEESILIAAIGYHGDIPEMPPKERLSASVVSDFKKWIADGAPDPRLADAGTALPARAVIDLEAGRRFWSFVPPVSKDPPAVRAADWPRGEIDRFILARQEADELRPGADAEPRALIRRLTFDLTGLPPAPERIDAFLADCETDREGALVRLVDELLASPAFGEKWARHWLDLARYADSNGGDINLTYPNAWRYRNYVVDAFNRDKPYDQFVREQLAGDLLSTDADPHRAEHLVASGFLIVGPKMLSERDKEKMHLDVADDQVDTVGRAFLGLTLGCARCHDHKFDPVPTADYYAMAGIFRSTRTADGIRMNNVNVSGWIERDLPAPPDQLAAREKNRQAQEVLLEQIVALKGDIDSFLEPSREPSGIVIDDPAAEVSGIWKASKFSANYVGEGYLHDNKTSEPISITWRATIPKSGEYEVRVSYHGTNGRDQAAPYTIRHARGETTVKIDQSQRAPIANRWQSLGRFAFEPGQAAEVTLSNRDTTGHIIADAAAFIPVEDLKQPAPSPDPEKLTKMKADRKAAEEKLEALKKEFASSPRAMAAQDHEPAEVGDIAIRVRGEPANLGPLAPRGFLQVASLPGTERPVIAKGESGRRELAEWIASPENPLTARVLVNRLWQHLFGAGLVRSVDNFGTEGDPPSHPELLDWLATDFVAHDWSMKHAIRQIVLSRTYRLASPAGPDALPEADPENRLLTHQNRRRLPAEAIRDALLAASGDLNPEPASSSVSHLGEQAIANSSGQDGSAQSSDHRHRSLYLPMVRGDMPAFLELFDMANPDMVTGERPATTVPGQALLMMNAPFVRTMASATVDSILGSTEPAEGRADANGVIGLLYLRLLGRAPTDYEASHARAFVAELEAEESLSEEEALARFAQTLIGSTEFRFLE